MERKQCQCQQFRHNGVCEHMSNASQNNGDWEGRFENEFAANTQVIRGVRYFKMESTIEVKNFIRLEIDRAERRVKEKLREEVEEMETRIKTSVDQTTRDQRNGGIAVCHLVLNLL